MDVTGITARQATCAYSGNMNDLVTKENKTNELYAPLSAEMRQMLEKCEEMKTVAAGTRLISHGISPAYLFIINSGSVEVSVPSVTKTTVSVDGSGKVFGLHALVSGELPKVDVTSLENCTVALIPRDKFAEILRKNPQIYFAIAKVLSQDLQVADELLRRIRRAGPGGGRGKPN
jgi:CRP-like cAMP-binding protein